MVFNLFDFNFFKNKDRMFSFFKLDLVRNAIISKIINGNDSFKVKVLCDNNLVNILKFGKKDIISCINGITSDNDKIKCLISNISIFNEYDISLVLSTFTLDNIIDFFNKYNSLFSLYDVIKFFDNDLQLDIIKFLDEIICNGLEKRKILATLNNDVKEKLCSFGDEREELTIDYCDDTLKPDMFGKILVNFDKDDFSVYEGLDDLIYFNGTKDIDKEKLYLLFKLCPNIKVRNNLVIGFSSVDEYMLGEKWIDDVLSNIDTSWSDVQKLAFIDCSIGMKVSYSPDFETEFHDRDASRALWKIICSGYGVCNGISDLEKYMLGKVGIDSDIICSEEHAFLRVNNIEIDGKKGDTLVDPTWNLTAYKFLGKPNYFCKSYDTIRKYDIDAYGNDTCSHKNDFELNDVSLELSDNKLRDIFSSIGFTDKDGNFLIKDFIDKSDLLVDFNLSTFDNIKRQLDLLKECFPNFCKNQLDSMSMLNSVLLNKNFEFNECFIDRVFSIKDGKCHFFISVDGMYFVADNDDFIFMDENDFFDNYSFFDKDIEKDYTYVVYGKKNKFEREDR